MGKNAPNWGAKPRQRMGLNIHSSFKMTSSLQRNLKPTKTYVFKYTRQHTSSTITMKIMQYAWAFDSTTLICKYVFFFSEVVIQPRQKCWIKVTAGDIRGTHSVIYSICWVTWLVATRALRQSLNKTWQKQS